MLRRSPTVPTTPAVALQVACARHARALRWGLRDVAVPTRRALDGGEQVAEASQVGVGRQRAAQSGVQRGSQAPRARTRPGAPLRRLRRPLGDRPAARLGALLLRSATPS